MEGGRGRRAPPGAGRDLTRDVARPVAHGVEAREALHARHGRPRARRHDVVDVGAHEHRQHLEHGEQEEEQREHDRPQHGDEGGGEHLEGVEVPRALARRQRRRAHALQSLEEEDAQHPVVRLEVPARLRGRLRPARDEVLEAKGALALRVVRHEGRVGEDEGEREEEREDGCPVARRRGWECGGDTSGAPLRIRRTRQRPVQDDDDGQEEPEDTLDEDADLLRAARGVSAKTPVETETHAPNIPQSLTHKRSVAYAWSRAVNATTKLMTTQARTWSGTTTGRNTRDLIKPQLQAKVRAMTVSEQARVRLLRECVHAQSAVEDPQGQTASAPLASVNVHRCPRGRRLIEIKVPSAGRDRHLLAGARPN